MTRDGAVLDLSGAFENIDHRVPDTTGAFLWIPCCLRRVQCAGPL